MEYLGYIISDIGVQDDPGKLKVMQDWPTPHSVKSLRGFLELTGYYRKFIRSYGMIAKNLTLLTKKCQFNWIEEAQEAFKLKNAMINSPILRLPDFSKPFVVETDANYGGLGVVLIQEGQLLAFLSKALRVKNLGLSLYEKEFLAIILAVEKWRSYLLSSLELITRA